MSDVTQHRWMREVRAEDYPAIENAALTDAHATIAPSHVFTKGGEIVGAISLGRVALALPWFDTRKCTATDSRHFINLSENLMAMLLPPNHSGIVCVPFMPNSPFHPFINKLGYGRAVDMTVTFKPLRS